MLEARVEITVCNYAIERGWLRRKMRYIGRRGSADDWFFRDGRAIIIEFKKHRKRADPLQVREHRRLAAAGFPVHVIDNIEAGCALFGP